MNKLEKMLYEADPSANAPGKCAALARLEAVDIPRRKAGRLRPALAAACVCLLLAGAVGTGAAQAAFEYIREVFFTKEIVAPEEIEGPFEFISSAEASARQCGEIESRQVKTVEMSPEEAKAKFSTPFMLPEILPEGMYLDMIKVYADSEYSHDGRNVFVYYSNDNNKYGYPMMLFIIARLDWEYDTLNITEFQWITDEKNITKYITADGTEVYSFLNREDHQIKISFVKDNFGYTFSLRPEEPLTDEEIIAMVDSMR